jgi:calcium channel MID1
MLYLGDSTSSQSLLFSSLLFSSPQPQSSYPNYTLSAAELPIPSLPEFSLPTFELLVIPTGSSPTANGLDYSHCAIRNANVSTGALGRGNPVINATTEWMAVGDEEGYRTYWVIGGLESSSNYTAWILDTSTQTMSQPIWFTTKQCTSNPLISTMRKADDQHPFLVNLFYPHRTAPR